jgi:hypothetical protein
LRQFFHAAFVHGDFLVKRRRTFGRLPAGFRQLPPQLPDLFGLRAVLLFQAVQPLYDLPHVGLPGIRRRGLRRQNSRR